MRCRMRGLPVVLALSLAGGCCGFRGEGVYVPGEFSGRAIQRAIDLASEQGGGVVRLMKGVYPSGTIYLKSGVELNVPEGAVILGDASVESYDDVDDPRIGKRPEKSAKAFIVCIDAEDVAITGGGVIDGQGPKFYDTSSRLWGIFYAKPPKPRPRMLQFFNCRRVRFEDITFKDSPGWTCWLRMCEDVTAERVKIHGDQMMINNDGFHVDGCRRTVIRDCDLRTGDDCVVMRANVSPNGDAAVNEDMLVEDCTLSSACQSIRLGCPSDGEIRRGTFRRLKMSGRNGIQCVHPVRYLQEGNSGNLAMGDILIEDCEIEVTAAPIEFRVEPGIALRSFGGVTFRNVKLRGSEPVKLLGTGDTMLADIRFENVTGEIAADTPLEVRSCRNLSLEGFRVTSGRGANHPPAHNDSDCWERIP